MKRAKLNKKVLTVSPLTARTDDAAYWHAASCYERLRAVEVLRQLNYGRRRCAGRLQRVLEVVHLKKNKKAAGRHKDLDDLENLP